MYLAALVTKACNTTFRVVCPLSLMAQMIKTKLNVSACLLGSGYNTIDVYSSIVGTIAVRSYILSWTRISGVRLGQDSKE